jgi:hypothetical protein
VADSIADLQARRALLVDTYERAAKGHAAHSVGDRSYSEHALADLRREMEAIDREIAALTSPASGGKTLLRLGRGR